MALIIPIPTFTPEARKEAELRVDRARWWALQNQPFYGRLSAKLIDRYYDFGLRAITPFGEVRITTAATDMRRIYWIVNFVLSLDDGQVRYVLLHETLHCAHFHSWRLPPDEKGNRAGDYVINKILDSIPGLKRPPDGLFDDDGIYNDKSEEEVYILLPEQEQGGGNKGKECDGQGQPSDNDSGKCGGFLAPDENDDNEDPEKKAERERQQEKLKARAKARGQGEPDGQGEDPDQSDSPPDNPAPGEQDDLKTQWEQAIQEAEHMARLTAGNMPGHLSRQLNAAKSGDLDWKAETNEFIRDVVSYRNDWTRSPKRHASQPVIYPRRKANDVGTVLFFRDTSGSISQAQGDAHAGAIDAAVSEIMCEGIVADIDTEIKDESVTRIGPGVPCPKFEYGGGGTYFAPAMEYALKLEEEGEKIAGIVYLTDGDNADDEETDRLAQLVVDRIPILWIIGGSYARKDKRAFGRTVFMPEM